MTRKRKDKMAQKMYEEYKKGFSLSEVGKMFNITRQSVYNMFSRRNFKLRTRPELPYQYFDGKKFSIRSNGYYGKTYGNRKLMHRYVWEYYNKRKIPQGYDIHHIDEDRSNNRISNLELIKKDEHARKYGKGENQYTKQKRKDSKKMENKEKNECWVCGKESPEGRKTCSKPCSNKYNTTASHKRKELRKKKQNGRKK